MKKLNRLALTASMLSVLLCVSGCDVKSDREKVKGTGVESETPLYIFTVQGKPLECISRGHGKSCNWEKYNKISDDT